MKTYADLVLRSPASGDIVLVELKNRRELTPEVAAALRRNMIAHGAYQRVPYFMIVSQDIGYVWAPDDDPSTEATTGTRFNMGEVIPHYYSAFDPDVRLREAELILIVEQWLDDLIHRNLSDVPDPGNTLRRSGLLAALRSESGLIEVLG